MTIHALMKNEICPVTNFETGALELGRSDHDMTAYVARYLKTEDPTKKTINALIEYFNKEGADVWIYGSRPDCAIQGGGAFFRSDLLGGEMRSYIVFDDSHILKWGKPIIPQNCNYTIRSIKYQGKIANGVQLLPRARDNDFFYPPNFITLIHELGHARQQHMDPVGFEVGQGLRNDYFIREGYNIRDTEWPASIELGHQCRLSLESDLSAFIPEEKALALSLFAPLTAVTYEDFVLPEVFRSTRPVEPVAP
ncbi:MAG: hypothetical protein WCP66_06975 [Methylococcales bacterium]